MTEYKKMITSIAAKPYCHFILAVLLLSCPLLFVLVPVGEAYEFVAGLISVTRFFAFILTISGVYMLYDKSIVKKYRDIEDEYRVNVKDLQSTSWENLKKIVVFYFRKYYFAVKFGKDKYSFIAEIDGFTVLIDCKHWDKEKVSYHDVVALYEASRKESFDLIYIVSRGFYSERAHVFSFDKRLKLISGYQLVEWMKVIND